MLIYPLMLVFMFCLLILAYILCFSNKTLYIYIEYQLGTDVFFQTLLSPLQGKDRFTNPQRRPSLQFYFAIVM